MRGAIFNDAHSVALTSAAYAEAYKFEWGKSDIVTSTPNVDQNTYADRDNYRRFDFSDSPILSSGVSGPSLYGYFQNFNSTGARSFNVFRMVHSTADYFDIRGETYNSEASSDRSIIGLVYFKTHFLLPGQSLEFSSLELPANIRQLNSGGTRSVRFAVLNGDQWYLSSKQQTGVALLNIADPLTATWALWDPSFVASLSAAMLLQNR